MTEHDIARLLARRLEESGQDPAEPVSVAELHRVLLPYHECRDLLGFASKAEYDLALLHLLDSGRHIRIDPALADAVGRELSAVEPGLGFLRNFAAAQLSVVIDLEPAESRTVATVSADPAPAAPARAAASGADAESVSNGAGGEDGGTKPEASEADPQTATGGRHLRIERAASDEAASVSLGGQELSSEGATPSDKGATPSEEPPDIVRVSPEMETRCRHCAQTLPEHPDLRFCPHCGRDQRVRDCAECGDELQLEWSFCPRCGMAVAPP